jgi:hypothetical protein
MAYLKPSAVVRKVFNPLAMRFGLGGTEVLVVPRRRTGTPQRIPVTPVELEGARYLVSTRGEADWVKNVRAAESVELDGKRFQTSEVPVAEREPIFAVYKPKVGRVADGYWKKLPDASDHPVFRLDPIQ